MTIELMQTDTDCGPRGLRNVSGAEYSRIIQAWGWASRGLLSRWFPGVHLYLENASDNPSRHRRVMRKLGIKARTVNCEAIIAGSVMPGKVLVLVHNPLSYYTSQHWAVYLGQIGGKVVLHWQQMRLDARSGEMIEDIRYFTPGEFRQLYSQGSPSAAYEVAGDKIPGWSVWMALDVILQFVVSLVSLIF